MKPGDLLQVMQDFRTLRTSLIHNGSLCSAGEVLLVARSPYTHGRHMWLTFLHQNRLEIALLELALERTSPVRVEE